MKRFAIALLSFSLICLAMAGCVMKPSISNAPELFPADQQSGEIETSGDGQETKAGEAPKTSFAGSMESFSAPDMEGNTVTEAIFSDFDVTMVNIWTTWCGYCIMEMPDLQELYENLPDNVNLISVCGDADTERELVAEILLEYGITFTVLEANDDINRSFISGVQAYPTTVFLDGKGRPIGNPQLGIPSYGESISNSYMLLIDAALETIGK
ncbi:MAG: TlpA family protein disulfide reductase [Clostridiales bacterium]|nr:TlpA family protein disulfide reductase [Clostridiales bacterium]